MKPWQVARVEDQAPSHNVSCGRSWVQITDFAES